MSEAKFEAAETACKSKLPKGSFTGHFPGGAGAHGLTNIEAYESCLTSNGVKLSGTGYQALASLDRTNPTVEAAMKTCAPLLQAGTTTTTAPSG